MTKLMKIFVFAAFFACGISTISFAQITKADVKNMFTMQKTTTSAIKEVYANNDKVFYTDGTSRYRSTVYKKNKLIITESGLVLYKQGTGVQFYPYSAMKSLYVGTTTVTMDLLE